MYVLFLSRSRPAGSSSGITVILQWWVIFFWTCTTQLPLNPRCPRWMHVLCLHFRKKPLFLSTLSLRSYSQHKEKITYSWTSIKWRANGLTKSVRYNKVLLYRGSLLRFHYLSITAWLCNTSTKLCLFTLHCCVVDAIFGKNSFLWPVVSANKVT